MTETSQYAKKIEQHIHQRQSKKKTGIAFAFLLLLLVAIVAFLYFFQTNSERVSIVQIKTNSTIDNCSKDYHNISIGFFERPDTATYKTAGLFESGDILSTNNSRFTFKGEKDSLTIIDSGDSLTYLDGELVGIKLKPYANMVSWFRNMTEDTIKNLRSLIVNPPVSEGYLPYIKKIAATHKNISIFFGLDDSSLQYDSYKNDIQQLSNFFTPEGLTLYLKNEDFKLLSGFKDLKTLTLLSDSISNYPLPPMPALRECLLETDAPSLNEDLFINNPQIEKLSIFFDGENVKNISFISKLTHLKQLITNNAICVDSLYRMAPDLTVLNVGDSSTNPTALSKFKKLKWLGLPGTINQQQFDTVLHQLPSLQVLEMCGNDSISSLKVITELKDLKGLVIAKQIPDSSTLLKCNQLRYLSIPEKTYNDSIFVQKLTKALPGCIIVPNSGACLGSGWLLLLVPLVAIILYFRNRYANASRQS